MRLQGKITQWEDDKGYGFITWHGDGSKVFVHIKAFARSSRRPALGDIVTYEIGEGKKGKPSALKVRFSEPISKKKPAARKSQSRSIKILFTTLYLFTLFVATYFNRIPSLVLMFYFIASLATFAAYGWDKSSAQKGQWRTAESSLHLMALVGGWPGALAAQRFFRHKSSKQEFLAIFWLTVVVNIAAVAYLAFLGETGEIYQFFDRAWRNMLN